MKKVEYYICETCGTQYKFKADCEKCEKSHCKPKEIVKSRYIKFADNEKGYPIAITLKMEDGKEVTYKR